MYKRQEQDYEPEYYVTESGKIEELTKEKELDMLNQAYETHRNFMEMCIRDRNRYEGELNYKDSDLPETTKAGKEHGIGLHNICLLYTARCVEETGTLVVS